MKSLINCQESTCNAEDLFDAWVEEIPWRRERLPTPVFWPGEFHGLYSPWDPKESDMTEWLSLSPHKSLKEGPTLEWMWIFTTDLGYIKSMGGQKNGVLQISKTCSPSGKTQNKQGSLSHLSQISGEHSKVYRNQVNTQSEKKHPPKL